MYIVFRDSILIIGRLNKSHTTTFFSCLAAIVAFLCNLTYNNSMVSPKTRERSEPPSILLLCVKIDLNIYTHARVHTSTRTHNRSHTHTHTRVHTHKHTHKKKFAPRHCIPLEKRSFATSTRYQELR